MTPGWYPDPTGRFPQRYFDGRSWTGQVVGANGMSTSDPVSDVTGLVAPSGPATAPTPRSAPPTTGEEAAQPVARRVSWYGLAVAAAGAALVTLSVTSLSWSKDASFSDAQKVTDTFESSSYDDALAAYHYGAWGWILALALVVAGLVWVAARVNRGDGTGPRLLVAAIAAIAAVSHAGYVAQIFEGPGPSPAIGAWAGSIGYVITIIGLAIATPRPRSRA